MNLESIIYTALIIIASVIFLLIFLSYSSYKYKQMGRPMGNDSNRDNEMHHENFNDTKFFYLPQTYEAERRLTNVYYTDNQDSWEQFTRTPQTGNQSAEKHYKGNPFLPTEVIRFPDTSITSKNYVNHRRNINQHF